MNRKHLNLLAGMSALLVGMSVLPAPSMAQGIELDLGNGRVRVQRPDDYDRRDDRRYYREDDRYDRRSADRGGCSPRRALATASRHIRQPEIRSVTRRYIVVDGYGRRGEPNQVLIHNDPSCRRAD